MKRRACIVLAFVSLLPASAVLGAEGTTIRSGNLTIEDGYLDLSPTGKGIIFPDGTPQTTAVGGVTSVTGAYPLTNSGTATNPVLSLTGTVPDGNLSANVCTLNSTQTVSGAKTFSLPITSTVATGTAPFTVTSATMVSNFNAEKVGGQNLADLDLRYASKPLPAQSTRTNSFAAVDSEGVVGYYTSITFGTDGLPIISYQAAILNDLKVVKCGNATCSSNNTITTIDSVGNVGYSTSIIIGTDGLPVISYLDNTNIDLKVAKCGNMACSSGNTITTIDSVGNVGRESSITIGADALPVISYYDSTNGDLKVAKCGNSACSSGNVITTVDSAGTVGSYSSIAIGSDGMPVISYYDSTNGDLKVAKCGNSNCSAGNIITTIDSAGDVGDSTSITIGTDGLPIIAYRDTTNSDLKVAKCGNASCSSGNTLNTIDSNGNVGLYNSITLGVDGLPVISYYDSTNEDLRVAKCGNASCSNGNVLTTVDSAGNVGYYTSISIGGDGLPMISYYDVTNGDLKVAKCASQTCLNLWGRR